MGSSIDDLLRRCCVSVQGRGTGFYIAPRLILSCFHVIGSDLEPGDELELVERDGTTHTAELLHTVAEQDLAFLATTAAGPEHVVLAFADLELDGGEQLVIVGYPDYETGLRELGSLNVTYDGTTENEKRRRLQVRGNHVVPGFSGSPLLNLHTGHVVGVIGETRGAHGALGGWAIPGEVVVGALGGDWASDAISARARPNVQRRWADALRDDQDASGAQYPQPALRAVIAESDDVTYFASQKIPFLGRERELCELDAFLGSDARFAWKLLVGPAGCGKSRLALELCLRRQDEWLAGFLTDETVDDIGFWRQWRPNQPSLLVADKASLHAEQLGALIRCLARKKTKPKVAVRVLLLERDANEEWFDRLLGREASDRQATLAVAARTTEGHPETAIANLPPSDIFALMCRVAPTRFEGKPQNPALKAFAAVDPEGRALFAILFALSGGKQLNRLDAIVQFLREERQTRWEPAGATDDDLSLLACATMCAGVPHAALKGRSASLDAALARFSTRRFSVMSGKPSRSRLAPLEPDLIGSVFVLQRLLDLEQTEATTLCGAAWGAEPASMAYFICRTVPEFPRHEAIDTLLDAPSAAPDVLGFWGSALVDLLRYIPPQFRDVAEAIHRRVADVAAAHPGNAELYELACRSTLNLFRVQWDAGDAQRAATLEADLLGRLATHPDAARARTLQARLLGHKIIAYSNLIEQHLAQPLAPAPLTFLPTSQMAANARAVFEDLRKLVKAGRSDPDFRAQYAAAIFHLARCYTLAAYAYPQISFPASMLVKRNVLNLLKGGEECYAVLKAFAEASEAPKEVCFFLARTASALSAAYANMGMGKKIKKLSGTVAKMSLQSEDAMLLREEYTRILFNEVVALRTEGNGQEAARIATTLSELAARYPDEESLAARAKRATAAG